MQYSRIYRSVFHKAGQTGLGCKIIDFLAEINHNDRREHDD